MVDVGHSQDPKRNEDEKEEPTAQEKADDTATKPDAEPEVEPSAEKPKKKQRSFWVELPILIGVALVLTILIQSFLARVFLIPSESMEHTLHGCAGCYGDRVLVDKLTYVFHDPRPGDVVVFQRPDTWNQSEFRASRSDNSVVRWLQDIGAMFGLASPNEDDVVKRVIAVGGQTVRCCDEQGRVEVDDRSLDEPYVFWDGGTPNGNQHFEPFQVPAGRPCCQLAADSDTGLACGLWSPTPCQRAGGSTMNRALPITLSSGTTPLRPPSTCAPPPWQRESHESLRLSPMTHRVPAGTFTAGKLAWVPGRPAPQ